MPSRMVILYVEDEPDWVVLVGEILAASAIPEGTNFLLLHEKTLEDAKKVIMHGDVDVIILDLGLPDSQGLATIQAVKEVCGSIPIVVVSALRDIELAKEAFKLGVTDFYEKSAKLFKTNFLPASLMMARERSLLFEKRETLKTSATDLIKKIDEQGEPTNG